MIDEGKTRDQVIGYFLAKYPGESALVVPIDAGFNRLAWMLPTGMIVVAAGALVVAARRWGKNKTASLAKEASNKPAAPTGNGKSDAEYESRLDDDLDELA
jgi:cytochrome c-type biogenesis protein CcmH/NrfF